MFDNLTSRQLKKLQAVMATRDGKPLDNLAAALLTLMGFELENEISEREKRAAEDAKRAEAVKGDA